MRRKGDTQDTSWGSHKGVKTTGKLSSGQLKSNGRSRLIELAHSRSIRYKVTSRL